MATQHGTDTEEIRIRTLLDNQAKALRAKNADGVMATYAENLVTFDLAPPLRQSGAGGEYKKTLQTWFDTWKGPIGYEVRDVAITADGEAAFSHGFVRITGTKVTGEHADVWARQTLCLRRVDGSWKIVHEHTSVPFYMDGSYKAAVDLEP